MMRTKSPDGIIANLGRAQFVIVGSPFAQSAPHFVAGVDNVLLGRLLVVIFGDVIGKLILKKFPLNFPNSFSRFYKTYVIVGRISAEV